MSQGCRPGPGDPWASLDGRAKASPGTPQFPHLLDASSATNGLGRNLVTRPPWKVAGVDYAVGINRNTYPTNGSLSPVTGALPSGFSLAGFVVTANSASPMVMDGFDFTAGGIHILNFTGGGGTCLITNCFFKADSTVTLAEPITVGATGFTIRYCEIDGNQANGDTNSSGVIFGLGCTAEYNYFYDGTSDCFRPDNGGTLICRYNLFRTFGWLNTAHPDYIQFSNSGGAGSNDNCVITFNTCYQQVSDANGASSQFRFNTQMTNPLCQYNTMTVDSTGQVDACIFMGEGAADSPMQIVNGQILNNYMMKDTAGHFFFNIQNGYASAFSPTYQFGVFPVISGNIDMVTGSTVGDGS